MQKIATVRDKHLRLNQEKISKLKVLLKAKTETEAIEKAMDIIIERQTEQERKEEIMKKIIELRKKIGFLKDEVAVWVREGRKQQEEKWKRLL